MEKMIHFEDLHEVVNALTTALDAKCHYTCGHSERVAEYSLLLAQKLAVSDSEQQLIHMGAHLHDIGKIGIPDHILNKPGKLTPEEYQQMQMHPLIGEKIVGEMKIFRSLCQIIRSHHEHFDGCGYPDGCAGDEIPFGARVVAVADALDAMVSFRAYRKKTYTFAAAIAEISAFRGTQFDPVVVTALCQLQAEQAFLSYEKEWQKKWQIFVSQVSGASVS